MSTLEPGKYLLRAKAFQSLLLNWYDQKGRKNLPWQLNKTPYRVWVSEIMLQQTQVSTVIPYFQQFMTTFPSVLALANAHEDEVLHLWAGLGYYSRARNLHRAAKMVIEQFAGVFPKSLEDLQQLPGIGRSTAGAILSIAFQQQASILDGNVKRVLARFQGIQTPIDEKSTEAHLWQIANYYAAKNRPGDYSQAFMDLGATCCTRRKPNCHECPLQKKCQAFQLKLTEILPIKKPTRTLPVKVSTFLICQKNNSVLLVKRPAPGIWGGLWSFPTYEGEPDQKTTAIFSQEVFGEDTRDSQLLTPFRHTFTHYHLDIHPILLTISTSKKINLSSVWYDLQAPAALGIPKPVQKILSLLRAQISAKMEAKRG